MAKINELTEALTKSFFSNMMNPKIMEQMDKEGKQKLRQPLLQVLKVGKNHSEYPNCQYTLSVSDGEFILAEVRLDSALNYLVTWKLRKFSVIRVTKMLWQEGGPNKVPSMTILNLVVKALNSETGKALGNPTRLVAPTDDLANMNGVTVSNENENVCENEEEKSVSNPGAACVQSKAKADNNRKIKAKKLRPRQKKTSIYSKRNVKMPELGNNHGKRRRSTRLWHKEQKKIQDQLEGNYPGALSGSETVESIDYEARNICINHVPQKIKFGAGAAYFIKIEPTAM